jgi:hypothetical protein
MPDPRQHTGRRSAPVSTRAGLEEATRMRFTAWCAVATLVFATIATAAEFGAKGGPQPANVDEITDVLRQDPYDLELLISFGTSKGGSAGHLALAVRDTASGDDVVYSANFYADRTRKHENDFYTEDLMLEIPKKEYLFGTHSSLGDTASFGLDFGEIYKRSVVGVRVFGVPDSEKAALAAYFRRINDDYRRRARNTEYHDGEIKYDYTHLNCAKTIGSAFRYGAAYEDLEITGAKLLSRRRVVAAATANVPTEMAMKLVKEWNARGYGMDVVFYRKYAGSGYVDPHEEEKVAFKDLPNRFPSVLSRDFRRDAGEYEDFDNLFAVYLLYNMARYSVRVNGDTKLLEIDRSKSPIGYPEAAELAARSAKSDSENFRRRLPFTPSGTGIGDPADKPHFRNFTSDGNKNAAP